MYATVEDLADFVGEPIASDESDEKRAAWALRLASGLVNDETGKSWEHDTPEAVIRVTVAAAARAWMNPESFASEGLDDWRGGGRPIEELGLYLTRTEKRTLARLVNSRRSGLGVMDRGREPDRPAASGYVPTPDGQPFPWY